MSLGVTAGLMGPAAAQPIRVFVGLESAATEAERVALALAELDRTGAFDRELLMVISPTGTDYVNYVAVETAAYLTRGDMASVAMQCSLRPSPLSLDRVAEGRRHYRMLNDAIHNALTQRPPAARGGGLLGESLGAWTSQDAFAHRGTPGLLDAGIDRAIWIGTPTYMSKWKQEVLHSDRPDVAPAWSAGSGLTCWSGRRTGSARPPTWFPASSRPGATTTAPTWPGSSAEATREASVVTGTGKVTVETLQRLVAAFNAHDLDAVMSFFTDDPVLELPRGPHPWGRRFQGREEVRAGLASRFAGIPDVHYGEDRHWVSGDRGCSEWLLTGTTTQGERIEVRGCDVFEFRGDKIARKDSYWKRVER